MSDADKQRPLLGIDIGGTKAVVVVARASGEILAETRLEDWTSGEAALDLQTLVDHSRSLLQGAGIAEAALGAIGLSAPGPLDRDSGRVIEAPNLPGWVDVPLAQSFAAAFGVPILLENDANAAALAEWRFGAGQGTRNLLYLTMSTGLGAGLILDGRLYRGASFQAGEVGHFPIVPHGRPCNCGLEGCLEAYTGGAALAEIIREDIANGEQTSILERASGEPTRISARLWIEALRDGDEYAARLRQSFLDHLAQGIAVLLPSFDPERVVLGTIIARNPDLFLDDLEKRVRRRTWPSLHHVELVPSELGDRLPAYAALSVASLGPPDRSPATPPDA